MCALGEHKLLHYAGNKLEPPQWKVLLFWECSKVNINRLSVILPVMCRLGPGKENNSHSNSGFTLTSAKLQTEVHTPKHLDQKKYKTNNTYPELWWSQALQKVKSTDRKSFFFWAQDTNCRIHRVLWFVSTCKKSKCFWNGCVKKRNDAPSPLYTPPPCVQSTKLTQGKYGRPQGSKPEYKVAISA